MHTVLRVLKQLEWVGTINREIKCPVCGNLQKFGHYHDCDMLIAIDEVLEMIAIQQEG